MMTKVFYRVALWAPFIVIAGCATPTPAEKAKEPSPLRLLIGDGEVRIEKSYSQFKDSQDRNTATSEQGQFKGKEIKMPGSAWVEESSEYSLLPAIKYSTECQIKISRESARGPAAAKELYTYYIEVLVKDGISGGPFESVINGEGEGLIQLGEYPVSEWKSNTNLVVNDTVVESWSYRAKSGDYQIVKKMGEGRYLKKTLKFDPYLKNVSQVKYEILQGSDTGENQKKTTLARLHCQS